MTLFAADCGFLAAFADPNVVKLILAAAAPATVAWCSLAALHNRNVRGMAAWAFAAQSGFLALMLSCVAGNARDFESAAGAGLMLLLVHGLAAAGMFAVISAFPAGSDDPDTLDSFAGLAAKRPLLAGAFTVALLSAAGMPPFAGFAARVQVISVAVMSRSAAVQAAALASLIASLPLVYCALRVIAYMYFRKPISRHEEPEPSFAIYAIAVTCAACATMLGIAPDLTGLLRTYY